MANRTISLKAQPLDVFGPTKANTWNGFTWGTGSWGQKMPGDTSSPPMFNQIQMTWSKLQTLSITDTFFRPPIQANWSGSNLFSFGSRVSSVKVYDGIFNEVFRDGVTNFISSVVSTSFSSASVSLPSYTTFVASGSSAYTVVAAGSASYAVLATSVTTWH
jgi:hypothetical protein